MSRPGRHVDPSTLIPDIVSCRSGDREACDRLCTVLREPVNRDVTSMLGASDPDREDVVQETLVAALGYLRRDGEFAGDLVRLAVTIARNRCRDILRRRRTRQQIDIAPLAEWLADPAVSALDAMAQVDRHRQIQRALNRLDQACRDLLEAVYIKGITVDTMRRRLGLGTVQAVYYRRSICLQQVRVFLQKYDEEVQGIEEEDPLPEPDRD